MKKRGRPSFGLAPQILLILNYFYKGLVVLSKLVMASKIASQFLGLTRASPSPA